MKNFIKLLFIVFSIFQSTAFSAKCIVNDPDISKEYVGECKNGRAHGNGSARGRDEYKGQFFNGDIHGQGIYVWGPSSQWGGQRYVGENKNGERTGKGTLFHANGNIVEGFFLNGNIIGKGIAKSIDGRSYVGDFLNNKFDGFGTYTVPLKVCVGNICAGKGEIGSEAYVEKGIFRNGAFIKACPNTETCVEMIVKSEADKAKVKAYSSDYRDIKSLFFDGRSKAKGKTVAFDAKFLELERIDGDVAMSVFADTNTELIIWKIFFGGSHENIIKTLERSQQISIVCRVKGIFINSDTICDLVELAVK
jgi:hypothetical protein